MFDRLRDIILRIDCMWVHIPRNHAIKQLDEVVYIGWREIAEKFYDAYTNSAAWVTQRNASQSHRKKQFWVFCIIPSPGNGPSLRTKSIL